MTQIKQTVIYTTLFAITGREKKKHQKRKSNKQQNNDKKIRLTNNLNYIQLSSNCYYVDYHAHTNKQVPLANIGRICHISP